MLARIIILLVLTLVTGAARSQDKVRLLGIETGINVLEGDRVKNERIRESSSQYYGDLYYQNGVSTEVTRKYAGVKAEIRSSSNYFALSSGIRFNWISSSLSEEYSSGHFYYLMRQSGTTTEYVRVNRINQVTNYVSIPLELRAFTYAERKIRLYFLAGTEFGVRVATKNDVKFLDPAMEEYESEVSATIEKPGTFYSTFYGRGGVVIGGAKPILDLGVTFPVIMSKSAGTLSEPIFGGGLHLQVIRKF